MELREVRLIIKYPFDFFSNNLIETFISNIHFHKIETHISEINRLAIIKMQHETNHFLLIINSQGLQLNVSSLKDIETSLKVFDALEVGIKKKLQIESIVFNGVFEGENSFDTYNHTIGKKLPEKIKVKMLGIDIQSENFEYRISLNKRAALTKVNTRVLLQCDIDSASQKANEAFEELTKELQELYLLL